MRVSATLRRSLVGLAIVMLAISGAGVPAAVLAGPPSLTGVEVSAAVQHDVSGPLRQLGPTSPSAANLRERPLRFTGPGSSPNQPDGAVQAPATTQVATTNGLNFAGVGKGDYGFSVLYSPPDTVGAVGATQYVQWVNTYLAVFDKATGAIAAGFPKAGNAVWSGFGGGCESNNDGDPIVQYDKAANRWILTQFSVSTTPYLQCVAVSTTSDATGSYNRYAFNYGSTQFNDYPKLGVWPDAYYVTFNMFTSFFIGPKVCAWDRARMLAGLSATQQCFQLSSAYGSVLPGDLDGATPPPAGAPNPMLSLGSNSLNLWRFHVDWTTPANTTLSGPLNLAVASFGRACNGSNCVPQPSTTQKLDSLGDRLMYRLAYRNFGDHESLVVNHSVSVGGSAVSSVRWYELRNANGSTLASGTPVVYQQGTLDASDGIHRWMGSIAMDASGDIAVGYSASSASVNPSIRYTGRMSTDALGTMQAESIIQAGSGSQLQNLSRWGDYSAMTVDPVNDCTFWFTSEYLKSNGTWNWSTKIASFSFPGCSTTPQPTPTPSPTPTPGPTPTPTPSPAPSPTPTPGATPTPTPSPTPTPAGNFTITASPQTRSIVHGATATYTITITPSGGFVGPVSLSATGVPAGSNASFNPSSTATTSTLTVTTGSTPAGSYQLTITGTSGSLIHTTSVSLKLR